MTRYRYTPHQIRRMTPYQQLALFNYERDQGKILHFDSEEEFLRWQMTTQKSR